MAQIPGTNISAPVVPNDSNDVFASHLAQYGNGGYRTASNLIERDAITVERRENLMLVAVEQDATIYQLVLGTVSGDLADDANWVKLKLGSPLYDAVGQNNDGAMTQKATTDAVKAVQAAVEAEKNRIDTLVANAPQALDTLAEIANQLAADEAGVAAILATQQNHTQQLATKANDGAVVHLTGDESIAGTKTFTNQTVFNSGVKFFDGSVQTTVGTTKGYVDAADAALQTQINAKQTRPATNVTSYGLGAGSGGDSSVLIGNNAGRISTGPSNTIVGALAGQNFTTSNYQVAIGVAAGGNGTGGFGHVMIGSTAAYKINGGSRSVFIGLNAGYNVQGGQYNVLLGAYTGGGIINNGDNICIGAFSGPVGDFSNTISLGPGASAGASNVMTVADSLKVGIGVAVPTEKLQVNGVVYSTTGGFKFPDGTIQTTAGTTGTPTITYLQATGTSTTEAMSQNATTTALGLKAPNASPAFSGTPTAPTPSTSSNDTQVVNSYWVNRFVDTYIKGDSPTFTTVLPSGVIGLSYGTVRNASDAAAAAAGTVLLARPLVDIQGFFRTNVTVNAQGNRIEVRAYGSHMYGGASIIRNSVHVGDIVPRSGSDSNPITIQGGSIIGQIAQAADVTGAKIILDNVKVYPLVANAAGAVGNVTVILRNGSEFIGCPPANTVTVIRETSVEHRTTTAVTFNRDAEYNPVYSGTFTVDDSTKAVGAVVSIYLGPAASQPTIPGTGYKLISGAYEAGKNLMYMFKVGANNQIQYTITNVD